MSRSKYKVLEWGDSLPLGKLKGSIITEDLVEENKPYFEWLIREEVVDLDRHIKLYTEICPDRSPKLRRRGQLYHEQDYDDYGLGNFGDWGSQY